MALKKTLQKIGEWVDDVSKATTGTIKATLEKGPLRDMIDDFAGIGGPIGLVFKIASRQIPDPTAEQLIASELSTTFFNQIQKARVEHHELCQEETWRAFVKDPEGGVKKANELLAREFSWLSLFGRSGMRTSRSWPLVGELADIAEAWFAGACRADGRLTLENRRTIDVIRGRTADALAETVEKLLQKPDVKARLQESLDAAGRKGLELLAEELSTVHQVRLFGEVPQDELFIPPRIKCADFDGRVPQGRTESEIDWEKVPEIKGYGAVSGHIAAARARLVVLFGDMGAGKSCLMRVLTSETAKQYVSDKKLPVVFVRWREIYQNSNLLEAIAEQVRTEYGLPTEDLSRQDRVVYFIDGFDEMSSHQNEIVWQLFLKLAKLVDRGHTVVVAMRSAVVTTNIQTEWRERKAFVVRVLPFEEEEVSGWAIRWRMRTADVSVTDKRLRQLADKTVTANPLLLYMLARYVHPLAVGGTRLSRAEVFRTFVDETISGKLQKSGEQFPLPPDMKDGYRLLLQEMAYLASWPKSNGKCSEALLKDMLTPEVCEKLRFKDVRTAFVLHFFDPGDVRQNEFEFQPEGFRQYLLAEWCARALLEVHQDPLDFKPSLFRRKRDDAMQALAQFPLREVERLLLDELVTEFGQLTKAPEKLVSRLRAFGFTRKPKASVDLMNRILHGLWADVVAPPSHGWKSANVGVPDGQVIPDCLDSLRLLVNYWDQCLMGYFGLSRGLSDETPIPHPDEEGSINLGRFLRLRSGVRDYDWQTNFNFSRQTLAGIDVRMIAFESDKFSYSDLSGADFNCGYLGFVDMTCANLVGSDLTDVILRRANLRAANLSGSIMRKVNANGAIFIDAKLIGSDLMEANLVGADLTGADLTGANLTDANLGGVDLTGANLSGANLEGARLPKGFKLPPGTKGTPRPDEGDSPDDAKPEAS
ncbi:Secreted effector protein pipB2 [Gemmata sp. SH-PL17]|uniref:pentapeptide repeat-containing protein n=1 Tax=Gemmata sp. SH-PL17 TaxID=1630693 RepID=UPI00078CFAB3|nr:pentapeptide repeat-containing protein [Gemmata sp. SH-PL17]AMV27545.1 Secreted effector protein pipB2 [Gemmata sp. SH-PL17]